MRDCVSKRGSRKAIATHTIVLIIMMGLFAMFSFILFYKWIVTSDVEATRSTCSFKRIAYCTDWKVNNYGKEPWSWEDKPPAGCAGLYPPITKPTKDECEELM